MTKLRLATIALSLLVLLLAKDAFAQAADTPYQVGVVTNDLTRSDALLAFSNTGASATTVTNGALCVNVYAMSAANGTAPSAVSACCTCKVQPNGFASVSVNTDILAPVSPKPKNAVIKLMASTGTGGVCNAQTVGTGANVLATGMVAWQTQPQSAQFGAPGNPNIPFTPSTLSAAELTRLNTQCTNFSVRTCNAVCNP
jgi:hypothetical protein